MDEIYLITAVSHNDTTYLYYDVQPNVQGGTTIYGAAFTGSLLLEE